MDKTKQSYTEQPQEKITRMNYNLSNKQEIDQAFEYLQKLVGSESKVTITKLSDSRTARQNRAMHVYFELLAKELNDAGLSMMKVLKPEAEIQWTAESVKNHLWRPIQVALLGKESTTKLETKEVGDVYETLNRYIGEKLGVHVAFPSDDQIH